MKAPIPPDEEQRIAALYRFDVLDQPLQDELEGIVRLARVITGASIGVVNLIDRDRQWQACAIGMNPNESSRDDSMCAHTIIEHRVVHVPDSRLDARFSDNPYVTGGIANVRMYASAPLITDDGSAIGTICTVDEEAFELDQERLDALEDLAQQLVTIFELRRKSRLLTEANRSLDAFAGVIAHDLRNSVTAVMGFAEMARSEICESDMVAETLIGKVESSADRMAGLIDSVLAYSKSAHRNHVIESIEPHVVAESVVVDLDALIRDTRAEIEVSRMSPVRADSMQLHQLILNLTANAIVHTATDRRPHVIIAGQQLSGGVVVTVEDNGRGIPVEEREFIFDPFRRGGSKATGHGLGLATCKNVVERHGGRIWIDTGSLGGARFCAFFPDNSRPTPTTEQAEH